MIKNMVVRKRIMTNKNRQIIDAPKCWIQVKVKPDGSDFFFAIFGYFGVITE